MKTFVLVKHNKSTWRLESRERANEDKQEFEGDAQDRLFISSQKSLTLIARCIERGPSESRGARCPHIGIRLIAKQRYALYSPLAEDRHPHGEVQLSREEAELLAATIRQHFCRLADGEALL